MHATRVRVSLYLSVKRVALWHRSTHRFCKNVLRLEHVNHGQHRFHTCCTTQDLMESMYCKRSDDLAMWSVSVTARLSVNGRYWVSDALDDANCHLASRYSHVSIKFLLLFRPCVNNLLMYHAYRRMISASGTRGRALASNRGS